MNRTELVENVATATGLEKRQAETAVMAVIDSVVGETKAGNKVSIFGFGTFTPSSRAARSGRNPRTGAAVKIAARNVVKFKPATAYNAALNTRSTKRSATTKKAAPAKATPTKTAPVKAAAASKTVAKKAVASATKRVAAAKAPAKTTVRAAKATVKATAKAPAKAPAKSTGRAAKATKATKATKK